MAIPSFNDDDETRSNGTPNVTCNVKGTAVCFVIMATHFRNEFWSVCRKHIRKLIALSLPFFPSSHVELKYFSIPESKKKLLHLVEMNILCRSLWIHMSVCLCVCCCWPWLPSFRHFILSALAIVSNFSILFVHSARYPLTLSDSSLYQIFIRQCYVGPKYAKRKRVSFCCCCCC